MRLNRILNFKFLSLVFILNTLTAACGTHETTDTVHAHILQTRTGLSISQWFSKQGLSPEEIRTVDAILISIETMGGPSGNPEAAARFAERKLNTLGLDGDKLTDISPILALKGIVHLGISGNNFTQAQVEELMTGLPNLKTILVSEHIACRSEVNPRVKCLK